MSYGSLYGQKPPVYNDNQVLSDNTKLLYGLSTNATPDMLFQSLYTPFKYDAVIDKTTNSTSLTYNLKTNSDICTLGNNYQYMGIIRSLSSSLANIQMTAIYNNQGIGFQYEINNNGPYFSNNYNVPALVSVNDILIFNLTITSNVQEVVNCIFSTFQGTNGFRSMGYMKYNSVPSILQIIVPKESHFMLFKTNLRDNI